MKKVLIALFCMLSVSVFACNGKDTKTDEPLSETLPTTSWYSNQFKTFWADFVYEVNASKKPLKRFKPSAEMVEFHSIQKDKRDYVLVGYIQTKGKEFDAEAVRKSGVTLNEMLTDIYSFRCPLRLLPEFVKTAGVKSFEAGKKLDRLHK